MDNETLTMMWRAEYLANHPELFPQAYPEYVSIVRRLNLKVAKECAPLSPASKITS